MDVFGWEKENLTVISTRLDMEQFSKINKREVAELYKLFKIDSEEIIQLDDYFLEYFIRLLKRLRDINFEDVQKQKNLII